MTSSYLTEASPSFLITHFWLSPSMVTVTGLALRKHVVSISTVVTLSPCDAGKLAAVAKQNKIPFIICLHTVPRVLCAGAQEVLHEAS